MGNELEEIRQRLAATSPGPWKYRGQGWVVGPFFHKGKEIPDADELILESDAQADGIFAAAAKQDIPFLLATIDRLTIERDSAVAHDRQPYPTADAYERVCAALSRKNDEIRIVRDAFPRPKESVLKRNTGHSARDMNLIASAVKEVFPGVWVPFSVRYGIAIAVLDKQNPVPDVE